MMSVFMYYRRVNNAHCALDLMVCLFCVSTGKSSTKYAQIDITATETAHKVGTQHALGREEGLHTMEQRRRGAQQ